MNKKTTRFYNAFAHFYPLIDFFLENQKPKLAAQINLLAPGHILEIGVGNGKHIQLFEKHQFTGVDTSDKMLEKARQLALENVRLIQMDGENLAFDDASFDHVILSHVVSVVSNAERMLAEAYRVTKNGGKLFILNHFTPNNWMKKLDQAFHLFSPFFHFKSLFYKSDLKLPAGYRLEKEIKCSSTGYYLLLIYVKA